MTTRVLAVALFIAGSLGACSLWGSDGDGANDNDNNSDDDCTDGDCSSDDDVCIDDECSSDDDCTDGDCSDDDDIDDDYAGGDAGDVSEFVCGDPPSQCEARNCITEIPGGPAFEDCCDSWFCNCDPETGSWEPYYCDGVPDARIPLDGAVPPDAAN